jgi:hypothetical protein
MSAYRLRLENMLFLSEQVEMHSWRDGQNRFLK